ncbi:hypothetical protein ACC703_03895 [Rhizobium ruizarguesonis]
MSSVDFLLSRRQQKMLAALIIDPCGQFGTNELVALGGPGTGAEQNVIRSFEASGIVVEAARGNQVLYSINKQHPIYPELRSICIHRVGRTFALAVNFIASDGAGWITGEAPIFASGAGM